MMRKLILAAAIAGVWSSAAPAGGQSGVATQEAQVKLNIVFGQPYYDKPGRDRPYSAPPYTGR